jgi:hypothetical protein
MRIENRPKRDQLRILLRPFGSTRAIFEGLVFAGAAGAIAYFIFKALGA